MDSKFRWLKPVHREEHKLLRKVLSSGVVETWDVAIDAGAHVGGWTEILAHHFKRVVAIEPDTDNLARLNSNVAAARLSNVRTIWAAVMDVQGSVSVFEPGRSTSTARQVRYDPRGPTRAITIDSLGLENVGLIKLDVEGCEPLALAGAADTIKRCKPVLIVEISLLVSRFGYSMDQVRAMVFEWGYRVCERQSVNWVFVPC